MKKKGGSGYKPISQAQSTNAAPLNPILSNSPACGASDYRSQGIKCVQNFNNMQNKMNNINQNGGMKGGFNNTCGSNVPAAGTPMTVSIPTSVIPQELQGPHNSSTSVTSLTKTLRTGQVNACGDKDISKVSGGSKSKRRRRRSKSNRKKRTKRTKHRRTKRTKHRRTKRTKGRKSRRRR